MIPGAGCPEQRMGWRRWWPTPPGRSNAACDGRAPASVGCQRQSIASVSRLPVFRRPASGPGRSPIPAIARQSPIRSGRAAGDLCASCGVGDLHARLEPPEPFTRPGGDLRAPCGRLFCHRTTAVNRSWRATAPYGRSELPPPAVPADRQSSRSAQLLAIRALSVRWCTVITWPGRSDFEPVGSASPRSGVLPSLSLTARISTHVQCEQRDTGGGG